MHFVEATGLRVVRHVVFSDEPPLANRAVELLNWTVLRPRSYVNNYKPHDVTSKQLMSTAFDCVSASIAAHTALTDGNSRFAHTRAENRVRHRFVTLLPFSRHKQSLKCAATQTRMHKGFISQWVAAAMVEI